MTQNSLAGTVAIVTGASSGIGAATARALAQEGAGVALVARRRDRLDELAAEIVGRGGSARAVEADITNPDRAAAAVQEAFDGFGRLDILVNNAGIMLLGPAAQTPVSDWDRMISLNVAALVHVTHAALPTSSPPQQTHLAAWPTSSTSARPQDASRVPGAASTT